MFPESDEVEEVGDVAAKRLLHLQCHFGLDTLSWARRGAQATGADFSVESVAVARQLADELRVDAHFVCSDIYELPDNLDGRFDIVFTSYGVLVWLPDLTRWAETIAHFLDEGGVFYLVEEHRLGGTLVEEDGKLVAAEPYFDVGPIECPGDGTYADLTGTLETGPSYQWQHSLSDVIHALAGAGLRSSSCTSFRSARGSVCARWSGAKTATGTCPVGTTSRSSSRFARGRLRAATLHGRRSRATPGSGASGGRWVLLLAGRWACFRRRSRASRRADRVRRGG